VDAGVIAEVVRGNSMPDLISYLFGPGKHNVLYGTRDRSVMLQLLSASLFCGLSLGV
jgi:hypothetical protein